MNGSARRKRILRSGILSVGVMIILALLLYAVLLIWPQPIHVSAYTVEADIPTSLRIVQLTDLHNETLGKENAELISLSREQSPDLIVMTGDMLNQNDPDCSVIRRLIADLKDIAPVFYGYGNHEKAWERAFGTSLRDVLIKSGATVLEGEYMELEIRDVPIRIGGFSGFYGFTHMNGEASLEAENEQIFFDTFPDTDRLTILLNHIPTPWLDWGYIDEWDLDLVLCGHYHGGLMRIPFTEFGLYAPYVGWVPRYSRGCFEGESATCILSSGLGKGRPMIPRINNPPEIVVVDLVPAETSVK